MGKLGKSALGLGKKVFLKTGQERNLKNLYTGVSANTTNTMLLSGVAGLGALTVMGAGNPLNAGVPSKGNMSNMLGFMNTSAKVQAPIVVNRAPAMMADGVRGGERDLGATGAMVFGMHNKRHG